jgi:phosphoribosylanthranilate isomerase
MVLPTVKAIHVSNDMTGTDIANMVSAKPNLVSILLDTKDAKVTGGTGKAFDWNIAKELADKSIPFFLAGGLEPKNISEAVSMCRPFAVDVSSGVETDGKKDLEKIKLFVKNASS